MLGWFRRHAKVLMVVLGSAAMAIFGLGPAFDALSSPGRDTGDSKELIASWNGGEITRANLTLMEQRHYEAQRFLDALRKAAEERKGGEFQSLALPISLINDGPRELIDEQMITRFLMAERAKQEGVVVSDAMVNDYIAIFSGDAGFNNRDLEAINDSVNQYCSLQAVREQLKIELLANQMQLCTMTAVPIVPNPVESMELYGRTMEQIECEVLPIEVDKYVSKVTEEPTAAELKKLYEEGKYQFPDPTGEKPGFKIGRKVNVQYLIADYETYLQNEMNKLTDEEVQKEYERLVEEESDLVMEPVPLEDNAIKINDPTSSKTESNTAAPDDVTPTSDSEEGNGSSSEDAADSETPATETPSSEPAEGDGDQSYRVQSSKFQFTSTRNAKPRQQDPQYEGITESKETGSDEADSGKQDDEVGGIGATVKDVESGSANQEVKIERKVKPLKDVVDVVKRSMSEEAAAKAMEESLTKAGVVVRDHFGKRLRWETSNRKKGEEPAPLDHEALAKKYNLIAKETGLVDDYELGQSQIGRIRELMNVMVQGRPAPRLIPVAQLVFNSFSGLNLYDEKTVSDNWGTKSSFLYWLADKADTRIPSFEECRPEVEKFWRSQKALSLAMAEAETIKKNVNDTGNKKLSELYFERAFPTGAFTWFTNMGSTRYGSPMGVTGAGDEFMATAFSLAELEAGMARNERKDTVYVVQAITDSKGVEEVGTDYLQNQYFKYKKIPIEVRRVSQLYFQQLNLDWNEEFQEAMGLKFLDR